MIYHNENPRMSPMCQDDLNEADRHINYSSEKQNYFEGNHSTALTYKYNYVNLDPFNDLEDGQFRDGNYEQYDHENSQEIYHDEIGHDQIYNSSLSGDNLYDQSLNSDSDDYMTIKLCKQYIHKMEEDMGKLHHRHIDMMKELEHNFNQDNYTQFQTWKNTAKVSK